MIQLKSLSLFRILLKKFSCKLQRLNEIQRAVLQISWDMRRDASGKKDNLPSRATRSPGMTRNSLLPVFCPTQVRIDLQFLSIKRCHCQLP